MLPRVLARRFSIFLTVLLTVLLMLVPIIGTTVNSATRWLGSDAFRFQPSEFLKPVFVVTLAWMLSLRSKDRTLPVIPLSAGLTAFVGFLLMHQPDLGQTVIFCSAWLSLMLLAGMSAHWIGVLVGTGRSEEHTSELQSLMRISYAVFCLKKKKQRQRKQHKHIRMTVQCNRHHNK